MTFREPPADFRKQSDVATCYVEYDGKTLWLQRQAHKPQGGTWGLPGGKISADETVENAVIREVREETGLEVPRDKLFYFGKTFHRHGDYDFVYHMFSAKLEGQPVITINSGEHQGFHWFTIPEILQKPKEDLVEDSHDVAKIFYNL